jgi:hypothetical protein
MKYKVLFFVFLAVMTVSSAPHPVQAALWWSSFPNYDGGFPEIHACNVNTCPGGFKGWCNTGSFTCPLHSYGDVYVTAASSTQNIIGTMIQPGYHFGFGAYTTSYTGTIPTVPAGTQLTLEYACQDFQSASASGCSCTSFDAFNNCSGTYNCTSTTNKYNDYGHAIVNGVQQASYVGSMTVTPIVDTTYTVSCPASGWKEAGSGISMPSTPTMSFSVKVGAAVPPPTPTLTINGNGSNPTVITLGQSVTVTATFAAGAGDTLGKTAINDNANNLWCGTGCTPNTSMWTAAPLGTKSYTFTPVATGVYIFYPAATTTAYPSWNNYAKSLTVTVNAAPPPACQNGTGSAGACTSCNANYHLSGGSCVANACAGGQTNPPTCSTCPFGQHSSGGVCVNDTCADPHAVAPLCSTCVAGYQMQGGVCVVSPPSLSLSAVQTRVRAGTPASISWSATNVSAATSCVITSNPAGVFTRIMPAGTVGTWSGTNQATGAVTSTTIFNLSCTGANTKSITVGVLPVYQEI